MQNQKIPKIALIGCGKWGANIARIMSELGVLAAVADKNPNNAKDFAKKFNCVAMDNQTAIAAKDITAIAITTTSPSHSEIAIAGLNAGKDVFVEKPFALNLKDAQAIEAAANKTKKITMVGHLIRHHPCFLKLLAMVKAGDIGTLKHIRACRLAPGRIRDSESVLYDIATHDLALVAALTDFAKPKKIEAHAISHITNGIDDAVSASITYENNITATIEANWYHPIKIHCLTVIGSKAALVFDDTMAWQDKLKRYRFELDGLTLDHLDHGSGEAIIVPQSEPLKDEITNFIAAIKGEAPCLTDLKEGVFIQELLAQIESEAAR